MVEDLCSTENKWLFTGATEKEWLFTECINEIKDGLLNDRRIEVIARDPAMAQRIFYMTNDPVLGALFVSKYQNTDLHNAAHFVSVELVKIKALEAPLEFKPVEERISAPISTYTFLEDDYWELKIDQKPRAVDKNDRGKGNWDGALDNRMRAFEESGGVFL